MCRPVVTLVDDDSPGQHEWTFVVAISACPQDITRICGDKNTQVMVEVAG